MYRIDSLKRTYLVTRIKLIDILNELRIRGINFDQLAPVRLQKESIPYILDYILLGKVPTNAKNSTIRELNQVLYSFNVIPRTKFNVHMGRPYTLLRIEILHAIDRQEAISMDFLFGIESESLVLEYWDQIKIDIPTVIYGVNNLRQIRDIFIYELKKLNAVPEIRKLLKGEDIHVYATNHNIHITNIRIWNRLKKLKYYKKCLP